MRDAEGIIKIKQEKQNEAISTMRRLLWFLFVWEPLAELCWAWLRYCGNRRKNRPLTMPWAWLWGIVVYEVISGYGPGEVEHWRAGTPYEYRKKGKP